MGTLNFYTPTASGDFHKGSGDTPPSPDNAVVFKMPPYQDFQSQEIWNTAAEFLAAGVLKPPYNNCQFETDYRLPDAPVAKIRVEVSFANDEYVIRFSGKARENDPWKQMEFGAKIPLNSTNFEAFFDNPEVEESLKKEGLVKAAFFLFIQVFLCCLMAVQMRQFEQKEVIASEKLQRATSKRGKPPIKNYIQVSLRPECRAAIGSGHGGQKIPHWRRGHLRHLSSGAIVPVSPCMINWRGEVIDPKEYRVKIPAQKESA